MEIRLRILRWLSLLLLSAGIAAGTRMRIACQWFRRRCKPKEDNRETKYINQLPTDKKMEIRLRLLRWLSLLLLSAGIAAGTRVRIANLRLRRRCKPIEDYNETKHINLIQTDQKMEIRLRLLRWLSLLLLSAGIAAGSGIRATYRWLRRRCYHGFFYNKPRLNHILQTYQLKRLTMKIRIRLLRWLNLLQLSACLGCRSPELSHFALFRRR